eukprot:GHVR01176588.1.p1 GENE.GHVR01176588.1~~GHVR01176588.1.p1  ORF type:complete len:721 (+),score=150.28 GHVR01176588.1:151-2313(+)
MLSVEPKITEKMDIRPHLTSYIKCSYGNDQADKIKHIVKLFGDLRDDVSAVHGKGGYENCRQVLMKYMSVCVYMEQRFPIGVGRGKVNINFCWADAFRPRTRIAISSIVYEKTCVAFNLACTHTAIARTADRTSAAGVKDAIKHFQLAAGIFSYCREHLISGIQIPTTPDITDNALLMCSSVMLAQAQQCFYEKAVKDGLNRSLLSKLASQTAQFYSTAKTYGERVSAHIDQSWIVHYHAYELLFLSASHYQLTLASKIQAEESSEGWGSLIARLRVALDFCNSACDVSKTKGVSMNTDSLKKSIQTELNLLEKDNNTVYMEIIPNSNTLALLEMASTVKPAAITSTDLLLPLEGINEALDRLIPTHIRAIVDEFEKQKGKLVTEVVNICNKVTENTSLFLSARGLPFCVEENENVNIPDSLWEKIQQVHVNGGCACLAVSVASLSEFAQESSNDLNTLSQHILDEQTEDTTCRDRFGSKWSRIPSQTLNSNFLQSVNTYKGKLGLAVEANVGVERKLKEAMSKQHLFSLTRDQLSATLPSGQTQTEGGECVEKVNVRKCLGVLEAEVLCMQKSLDEFKKNVESDNITGELVAADTKRVNIDTILESELSKFTPQRETVEEKCHDVEAALKQLTISWDNLSKVIKVVGGVRASELRKLDEVVVLVLESFTEVAEGLSFFTRLLELVRPLKQQVGDFIFARQQEKADLLSRLTVQLAQQQN